MSFQIRSSTNSNSIHQLIMKGIKQLNQHERKVFSEARTRSEYADLLINHPIIHAILKGQTDSDSSS